MAWLQQAQSDRQVAEHLAAEPGSPWRCHVLAKYQQTVEKSIKAVVAALREAGVVHLEIGRDHGVERFLGLLLRLPHAQENRAIHQHLRALLDPNTRGAIRALDQLAPRWPGPGQPFGRNTEYPYQFADLSWTFPASVNAFSNDEHIRFRQLAHRIAYGAQRIVAAVRRRPR